MKLEYYGIETSYEDLRKQDMLLRETIKIHILDELSCYTKDEHLKVDFPLENEMGRYTRDVSDLFIDDNDEIIITIDNKDVKFDDISTSDLMQIIDLLNWIKNEK